MSKSLRILMCQYFRAELTAVLQEPAFSKVKMAIFPPTCGLQTPELPAQNASEIRLAVGSCCVAALQPTQQLKVEQHKQCFHLVADKPWIDDLLLRGVYLITPGWLTHWHQWLDTLGFASQASLQDYFHEFAQQLLLLDTGVIQDAEKQLQAMSDYLDLPYAIVPIGLDHLRLYLDHLRLKWLVTQQSQEQQTAQQDFQAQLANYAMAMDLVKTLARTLDESQAITTIENVFQMLFGAEMVRYSSQDLPSDQSATSNNWLELEKGFSVRIATEKSHYGMVQVDQLAFPQYKDHYLNVALVLTDVCGLAIENARAYQAVLDAKASLKTTNTALEETIDQLHRTQKQLVEAEKMASLGTLVAGVAHEINTPLGIGLTAVSSLEQRSNQLRKLFETKAMRYNDLKSYLEIAADALALLESNLQRIGELISSFKQVSIDCYTDKQRCFKLKPYLQDIVRSLGSRLRPGSIDIVIDCDEQLAIKTFPGVLAQMMTNLLLNSVEHGFQSRHSGEIRLIVVKQQNELMIDYCDNGKGIPAANRPKIFDPFFTTSLQKHTGLGMHILYNLVTQKLKGQVHCESPPLGGVRFLVSFPVEPLARAEPANTES